MAGEVLPKKKRRNSMCVGCGGQITDQYILRVAPDLEWHATCLKCADCDIHLDENCTCFVRDGKTYCKRDYVRLFGAKCAKCSGGFTKNDFVMRAKSKIYHIDCFRCVACSKQLIPGDEFAIREEELFCKADHDVVERASAGSSNTVIHTATDSTGFVGSPSADENKNNTFNNNNNETKNGILPADGAADSKDNNSSTSSNSSNSSGGVPDLRTKSGRRKDGDRKTTRVRTVLNEKQLHTLRTCYGANPRPDALMKEQLTEMTGLSQRVIRVWFQNKRCKDKKRSILMKQLQQQQQEKVSSHPHPHLAPHLLQQQHGSGYGLYSQAHLPPSPEGDDAFVMTELGQQGLGQQLSMGCDSQGGGPVYLQRHGADSMHLGMDSMHGEQARLEQQVLYDAGTDSDAGSVSPPLQLASHMHSQLFPPSLDRQILAM